MAFNRGRYVDAALGFHVALLANPTAKNLRISLAATYERLGLYQESIRRYDELIAENPKDASLLAGKARALAGNFQYRDARDLYARALDLLLDNGDVGLAGAQAQSLSALDFLVGNEQEATCLAGQSVKFAPSRAAALRQTRLLIAAGRTGEAEAILTTMRDDPTASTDPLVLFALAQVAYAKNDLNQALLLMSRALRTKLPDPSDALELQFFKETVSADLAARSPTSAQDTNIAEETEPDDAEIAEPDINFLLSRGVYWPAQAQASLAERIESADETV